VSVALVFLLALVTSIIPRFSGIILMIAIVDMKEDLCNFPKKNINEMKQSLKNCHYS